MAGAAQTLACETPLRRSSTPPRQRVRGYDPKAARKRRLWPPTAITPCACAVFASSMARASARRNRLFDKQMFAGAQGGKAERVVRSSAGEHIDDINIRALDRRCRIPSFAEESKLLARNNRLRQLQVADFDELSRSIFWSFASTGK